MKRSTKRRILPFLVLLVVALGIGRLSWRGCDSTPRHESARVDYPKAGELYDLAIEVQADGRPGRIQIEVEVAVGSLLTRQGLRRVNSLPANQGMLFLFKTPRGPNRPGRLTMKECKIPLSVAFIAEQGEIVQITPMDPPPASEESYSCELPHRFWLEMNQGFFEERDVAVGDKVVITEGLRRMADQWGE